MTRSLAELRQYLAGEWLFDNDFKDTSGNGNDGVPVDIEWASTQRGLKPRFGGGTSHVNCGNDSSLEFGTGDFTISLWVTQKSAVQYAFLVTKGAGAGTDGFRVGITANGLINILLGDSLSFTEVQLGVVGIDINVSSHIIVTFNRDGNVTGYINGVSVGTSDITSQSGSLNNSGQPFLISGAVKSHVEHDDIRAYTTLLSAAEALALYNATSAQTGVKISEFSYQHDPAAVIPVQTGEVLRIGGKLAGDAVDTISDRSGEGNNATIHGAMPADGFFVDGRRLDGADDYLDCGNDSSLNPDADDFIYRMVFKQNTLSNNVGLFNKTYGTNVLIVMNSQSLWVFCASGSTNATATIITLNKYVCVSIVLTGGNTISIYNDGVLVGSDTYSGALSSSSPMLIGSYVNNIDGAIVYASMSRTTSTLENEHRFFNTLAVLPFWSINYRDYPDNVTTYTDRFPHSSSIIASGAFKIDDDKIQCASAGTLTYSASHEFDGAEYITVTIAGTEYSGTGTITQGNTTVSVAQGSNKITVVMGTGDTIDDILITFRKPVTV